jgi:raffinose/stachyose/melibiose transport system substrate-binding protein
MPLPPSTVCGTSHTSTLTRRTKSKKLQKSPCFPAVEGGKGKADSTSGGAGWFIAANSKLKGEKLNAAEKFIMYVTGEKYSKDLAEKYGLVGSVNVGKADTSKFSNVTQEYVNLVNSGIALTPDL